MRAKLTAAATVLMVCGVTIAAQGPATVAAERAPHRLASSTRGAIGVAPAASPAAGRDPGRAGTASVIGVDGRSRVEGTTSYPSSAIGRLTFVQAGRSSSCTGFLVDADTVMTAGHCVHAGGTGPDAGWSTDVIYTPGQNGVSSVAAPFGSCRGVEMLTVANWSNRARESADIGWVQLDCRIGETTGWLAVGSPRGKALVGRPIHVRGYPAGKPTGTMWTDGDRVMASTAKMHFYRVDTFGGQSGSPAFHWRGCATGPRGVCVMAVHGYGLHGRRAHRRYNHGTRLTPYRARLTAAVAAEGGS